MSGYPGVLGVYVSQVEIASGGWMYVVDLACAYGSLNPSLTG